MTILLSRARMRILACSARVLFCVGVWLPAIGLRAEVVPTTAWAVRAGGILRVDADGVPLSFFSVENILKDVALNSSGSVLLAAGVGRSFVWGIHPPASERAKHRGDAQAQTGPDAGFGALRQRA